MNTKLVIAGTDLVYGVVVAETAKKFRVLSLDRTEVEVRIELTDVLSVEKFDQMMQTNPNPFDLVPTDDKYLSHIFNLSFGCVMYNNTKVYVGIFKLGSELHARVTTSLMVNQKLLSDATNLEEVYQDLLDQQVAQLDEVVEKLKLKLELNGTHLVNTNVKNIKSVMTALHNKDKVRHLAELPTN